MNDEDKIMQHVDDAREETTQLCCELVRAGGENPPGDVSKPAGVIEEFLHEYGLDFERYEPVNGRVNLISRIGQKGKTLLFCGHIDVVPAGDPSTWTIPPYSGTIKDGDVFGRGSSDMKGGVAALLTAFKTLATRKQELNGSIQLAIVCDEETGGEFGVRWLAKGHLLKGDACIIAEPTGYLKGMYTVVAGQKGLWWAKFTSIGKSSHGSTPFAGINAILQLTEIFPKFQELARKKVNVLRDAKSLIVGTKRLIKKFAASERAVKAAALIDRYTVNIGKIVGGQKANIVPDRCDAHVDIRIPIGGSITEVEEFVESFLPLNVSYDVLNEAPTYYTPNEHIFVKLAQTRSSKVFGYNLPAVMMLATSDAHTISRALNIPIICLGPGFMSRAHRPNEYVRIADLIKMAKLYSLIAKDYLH